MWQKFRTAIEYYQRVFSIEELRENKVLQWMMGGLLLYIFLTFSYWINSDKGIIEAYKAGQTVCWPYWQSCGDFFFLHDTFTDYSRGVFYMLLYAVMLGVVYAMWRRRWTLAHALFLILFVWEALVALVFSYVGGPYYYYNLFLAAILLFIPHKEYFLRLSFVLFYFLSVTIKFDAGWILGTYFSSLKTGLPIFPDALIPLFTNIVIFSQVVLAWFLLSKNVLLQRTALGFFIFFHLYSGILVSYAYPTAAIVPLIILFGPMNRVIPAPFTRRAIAGWSVVGILVLFQAAGFLIPGDRRLTLEGNRYGMFMFEANHQCSVTTTLVRSLEPGALSPRESWEYQPGTLCYGYFCLVGVDEREEGNTKVREERFESNYAMYRCDPYEWYARLKARCREPSVVRAGMTFDHSVNGGPFYRIVDEADVCALEYKAFSKNEWIKEPPEAPIMGYPVKNVYHY